MKIGIVFITQLVTFTVAGTSQLFALSHAASKLSEIESGRFMYLLALSSFLSFLDFGIFWALFLNLQKKISSKSHFMKLAYKIMASIGVFIGLIFTLFYQLKLLPLDVLIVISLILLNNFLFVGLVGLRSIKGEIFYFCIFNASWPLTFLLFQCLSLTGISFHSIFAVVPIIVSAILNTLVSVYIYFTHISKRSKNAILTLTRTESILSLTRISFYSSIIQFLSLAMLYGDRFLVFQKLTPSDFLDYAICVQYGSLPIVLILNLSSSIVGSNFLQETRLSSTFANGVPVIPLLGLILGISYIVLMPVMANLFFTALSINFSLVFLIALHIFLSSIEIQIYQKLWIDDNLQLRVIIQCIGITTYLIYFMLILNEQVDLRQAGLALVLSHSGILAFWLQSFKTKNGIH